MGGLISGILGGGNSGAQEAQLAEMAKAREAIQGYRPEAMNARINALRNASGAYQGANNALETMYGGSPSPKPTGLAGMKDTFGKLQDSGPKRFMGHDLPQGMHPSQGPMPGATPTGGPGAPGGQPGRPQHLGDGNRWEDQAAMMIDPLGIFRGFL